jgi:hypothetical protein
MKKLIPETILGKIWVLILLWGSVSTVVRDYQRWGDSFGVAFLIDLIISVAFNYIVFYALPVAIYVRQKEYFQNKKNKKALEEE